MTGGLHWLWHQNYCRLRVNLHAKASEACHFGVLKCGKPVVVWGSQKRAFTVLGDPQGKIMLDCPGAHLIQRIVVPITGPAGVQKSLRSSREFHRYCRHQLRAGIPDNHY